MRATDRRAGLILGAITLVLLATTAEARFRGGRSVPVGRSPHVGTGIGVGVGAAYPTRTAQASASPPDAAARSVTLRPILPVTAPVAGIKEVRAAPPKCADARIVGSGAGFCQIN